LYFVQNAGVEYGFQSSLFWSPDCFKENEREEEAEEVIKRIPLSIFALLEP